MAPERLILCGGAREPRLRPGHPDPVRLRLWGQDRNVFLTLEDVRRRMYRDLPPALLDLLDVAAYVYAADQAVHRGGSGADDLGASWRRNLVFRVPVRDPDRWRSPAVHAPLVETLSFLSEDTYRFEFEPLRAPPPAQQYVQFGGSEFDGLAEEVVLFSGGLDSLGGAVQEAVIDRRKVLLVNHRSTPKVTTRHQRLVDLLVRHAAPVAPLHAPVRVNKASAMGREFTQRSRSFLCAALGATFAAMIGLDRVRFYENGVVSLNLPPLAQVVGARATRTTHPRVLAGFSRLLTALVGRPFAVENPFLWKTKADVVELIAGAGCGELIGHSTSCGGTIGRSNEHPHCGECSQCVDRRFAVLATGQAAHDPAGGYEVDLLTGEREEGASRALLVGYLQTAEQIEEMTGHQFLSRFGEVFRALSHIGGPQEKAAARVFDLLRRHARAVNRVVTEAIAANADAIRRRTLPDACLVRLVSDGGPVGERPAPPPDDGGVPPPPPPLPPAENLFQRWGQVWMLRFAGGRYGVLLPSRGAAYLHILISQPGTPAAAVEMAYRVARRREAFGLGDAGERLDQDAVTAYRARIAELREEQDEARRNNDPGAVERATEELEQLQTEIRRAVTPGGRLRKEADDRDRVRKAVGIAIRRAIQVIADTCDPNIAEHLRRSLRCGIRPCYTPGRAVDWLT